MEETNPTILETPFLRPEDIEEEDNPIPKRSPNCLFCKVNPKRSETSDYCKECWEKKQESKEAARLASKNGHKKLTPEAKIRTAREKMFANGELCTQCTHRTPQPGKTLCVWCEEHGKPVEQIFDLSDLGNASRFEWRYGAEFLWTKATGWLRYKDGLWLEDKTHTTDQAMVHAITLIREEAALVRGDNAKAVAKEQEKILKFAQAQKSNAKINAALERASKLKSIAKDYAEFDTHDNLFHCSNGELDLETMVLLPHNPAYLATKGSSIKYDPTAECPGFEKYIHEVMGNNDNLIRYIQRCAGYTLTTATGEAAMFILTGTSGTGKTTFLNIIQRVMGLYAMRAQRGTLMAKRGDEGQPFDYAGLEGCRALVASETEEGKQIAVAKVKELSGNEKSLRACRKFRDSYEFEPKCKVWLACNDFPKAPAGDEALWDRLKPIPFDVKFRGTEGEVKDLAEKLVEEEGSGILNWMLRGLEEYTDIGLAVPEEAKQKAQALRDEQDFLGRFLEERTAKTDANGEMVLVSKLYDTFKMHSDATGEGRGWTRTKFNAEMRTKGYEDKKVRVGDQTPRVWVGVKLVSTISADHFMGNVEVL